MFKNLFGKSSTDSKEVACQITGKNSSLEDTVSLIKINGIIISKNFDTPKIDTNNKYIHSNTKAPIQYYREILVPSDLQPVFGRLFAQVEDEDEIETSTAIISNEGIKKFTFNSLRPIVQYLAEAEVLQIPDSMFFPIISQEEQLLNRRCEHWNIEFNGVGRKYMSKKILDTRKDKQQFGLPGIMLPGWDVGISDVSQKHPQGHGYLFKTDKQYKSVDLCSNESAVSYCKKNNVLIYYNDFMNMGKLRLLSEYTPQINKNLENPYIYRSSNI